MANQANSREQRLFLVPEVTYGNAVAPTAADAVLFERFNVANRPDLIMRRDKTGSRGVAAGVKGRCYAGWDLVAGLTPHESGPGALPALHQVLLAGMGAHAVTAGASVEYTLTDTIRSISSWDYRSPSTMAARCGAGLTVGTMAFALGADYLTLSASGEGKYCIYSDLFATLPPANQCGLATFAPEPATPDYSDDGGIIIGFTGSVSFEGSVLASIRSAMSRIVTGNATRKDTVGQFIPDGFEGMTRIASTSFSLYDEDGPEATAIREAAETKTPVDVVIVVGFETGRRFEFTHKGVQLASYSLDDSAVRWTAGIGDSSSSESAPGARDEYKIKVF